MVAARAADLAPDGPSALPPWARGPGNHQENGDGSMSQSEQKIVQYLNEAHATEVGLVRVLQSQIAMTPRGSYRTGLEKHLRETESHAERVQARGPELPPASGNPLLAGIGFMEAALSQTLAL